MVLHLNFVKFSLIFCHVFFLRFLFVWRKKRSVPESLATGFNAVSFKKKGNHLELNNCRPIIVLNSDYKILANVLANRLKEVVGGIISPAQRCSIPDREITHTICSILYVTCELHAHSFDVTGKTKKSMCPQIGQNYDFQN